MIIDLQEVKAFLHLDYDEEDAFLQLCLNTAIQYVADGITDYYKKIDNDTTGAFCNKVKLVVLFLVQSMFADRTLMANSNEKIKFIIQSLMLQMEYCDTGEASTDG